MDDILLLIVTDSLELWALSNSWRSMPHINSMTRAPYFQSYGVIRLLIFAVISTSALLSAEVIQMKNGDVISGAITAKTNKVVSVKTRYAGIIHIQRSEVKYIGSDLSSAAVKKAARSSNASEVAPPISALDPTLVAATGSKAKSGMEDGKFTGNINFSLKSENGNTDKDEIDTDFSVAYRRAEHRFRAQGQLEYDLRDGENNKQDWQLTPTYDYFISDQLYASLMYSAKQEKYAGLNLRQSAGPSLGYQFYEGKPVSLMSALGFYYVNEDFSNKEDNDYFGPGWHLDYQHDLFRGKMQFYHRHYSVLSTEEFDKFLWHSWTGVKVPIIHGIVGSAEFEMDYDSDPAIRAESFDTTLRFKLGYEW